MVTETSNNIEMVTYSHVHPTGKIVAVGFINLTGIFVLHVGSDQVDKVLSTVDDTPLG